MIRVARMKWDFGMSVAAGAVLFATVGWPGAVTAVELDVDKYLTLKAKPRVYVVEETMDHLLPVNPDLNPDNFGKDSENPFDLYVELEKIVNLGKRVWAVIQANKPVVNVKFDSANALPEGVQRWTDLQGWKQPSSHLYTYVYENLYGMKVVEFSYRVTFFHSGNVRGKGRYLANASVVPAKVAVMWGYTFNANATVPGLYNAGTHADPVGALQLNVDWKIDTAIRHEEASQSYYLRGDGGYSDISRGNSRL